MRLFEGALILVTAVCYILLFLGKMRKSLYLGLIAGSAILLVVHILWEGARWQMALIYLLAIISCGIVFLSGNRKKLLRNKWIARGLKLLSLLLIILSAVLTFTMPVFVLPAWTGRYPVSACRLELSDGSRSEIYSSDEADKRKLIVTLWYPADNRKSREKSYITDLKKLGPAIMKQGQLPGFLLDYLKLVKTNIMLEAPVAAEEETYPLLLFSHGLGMNTEFYSSILGDIASHGYIIAAIDHPYGSAASVFSDGKTVVYKKELERLTGDELVELEGIWVRDIIFTLEQLKAMGYSRAEGVAEKIDFNHVGVFGHSFGGAASYLACYSDDRIKAGINMDGSIYSLRPEDKEADKTFMMLSTQKYASSILENNRIAGYEELEEEARQELERQGITKEQYDTMVYQTKTSREIFRKTVEDGGYFISISNSEHNNFSDFGLYSPVMKMIGMVGKMPAERGLEIINHYILEFFNKSLKGSENSVLSKEYPEANRMDIGSME